MNEQGQGRFWQASDDYHGVICRVGDLRLIVTPNGKRWALQNLVAAEGGAVWVSIYQRAYLSRLVPDLPAALVDAMPQGLPEKPGDFPRAWAEDIEAQRSRVCRAKSDRDEFAGCIAVGKGGARLVFFEHPEPKYALQVKRGGRWSVVARSTTRDYLCDIVWGRLPPDHRASAAAGDMALKVALWRLAPAASDYRGAKAENLGEAVALPGRPGAQPSDARRGRKAASQRGAKPRPAECTTKSPKASQEAKKGSDKRSA